MKFTELLLYLLGTNSFVAIAAQEHNVTDLQKINRLRTMSFGIILFPGFEPLDVYGPLEIIFSLSYTYKMTLAFISFNTGPVSSRYPPFAMEAGMPNDDYGYGLGPSTVATHTFREAPALDIILVPGGMGNVALEQENNTEIEDFLNWRFPRSDYLLSVCTGSVVLARSGLLNNKRATTNKGLWSWVTDSRHGSNITWVPNARWVEDGKIWTSSGVAAGMDMTYAFLKMVYGTEVLDTVMNGIEYAPHQDPHWDPFAAVHKVPGANYSVGPDCSGPLGSETRPGGGYKEH